MTAPTTPETADDGRPFTSLGTTPALGGREMFAPDPPKDGDPIYCEGHVVGRVGGNYRGRHYDETAGMWVSEGYIELFDTKQLPEHMRAEAAECRRRMMTNRLGVVWGEE